MLDRQFPRAYTLAALPPVTASTLGVEWALELGESLHQPISIYAPTALPRDVVQDHPAVQALIQHGSGIQTWRDDHAGHGVVVALWPDEKHLLEAEESEATKALVAVTWNANDTLAWAQAKVAEPLGGTRPDITPIPPLDPVVAEAVDSLGILVGQHQTANQRSRAAIAQGLNILRNAGYELHPRALHVHALGHGWRASNADHLRAIATRLNEGRIIQA